MKTNHFETVLDPGTSLFQMFDMFRIYAKIIIK
jgi:hypothetical protein